MKPLSRVIHVIAREVIARLFADAVIQRHPLWACALELELAAVMREYVAEDNRLDREVRETLERRGGQSPERFAPLKQELARERGFPLGDAGVAHMVKRMAERVEDSPLASSAGMPAHLLRYEIHALMRRHLGSSLEESGGWGRASLVMTPQLQQAIKLLQLSRMELLETVREEMETNPLLEQPEETAEGSLEDKAPDEASLEASSPRADLDPRPDGNGSDEETRSITPDVFVSKLKDAYTIVLNDAGLSTLRISAMALTALRDGAGKNPKAKEFIEEKLRSAQSLIRSIEQRQRILYKVTESIVKFQLDFLNKGIAHLKPLILRDVAEDIGLQESTVSRVLTGKFVHTPQGIFELKSFFDSAIVRVAAGEIAAEAVKRHIQGIVAVEEPRRPYSDQEIVELLRSRGIDIAGRTVAKYREVLGILPASKRRKPR